MCIDRLSCLALAPTAVPQHQPPPPPRHSEWRHTVLGPGTWATGRSGRADSGQRKWAPAHLTVERSRISVTVLLTCYLRMRYAQSPVGTAMRIRRDARRMRSDAVRVSRPTPDVLLPSPDPVYKTSEPQTHLRALRPRASRGQQRGTAGQEHPTDPPRMQVQERRGSLGSTAPAARSRRSRSGTRLPGHPRPPCPARTSAFGGGRPLARCSRWCA